jgi:hypothetical protein
MGDELITTEATPKIVRELEMEALAAYRAKYPDGPLWQDLHQSTRELWVENAERARSASPTATPKQE